MADVGIARRSAFHGQTLPVKIGVATVTDAGPLARWIYRGKPEVIAAVFGVAPSTEPSRAATHCERAALWLGPDEWLLLAPDDERIPLATSLKTVIAGHSASVVDVAHRQCGLVIDGPQAARLLSAGCPLDLDLSAFPVGMCTRTLMAKAEIVLWRIGTVRFHVECWRSFAPYVVGIVATGLRDLSDTTRQL